MSNNNLKLESLHLGSLHIFSTEYGSSSYMKVQDHVMGDRVERELYLGM